MKEKNLYLEKIIVLKKNIKLKKKAYYLPWSVSELFTKLINSLI